MRIIFTILILISVKAHATNYYVDNSGSDSNPGTSPATAWQTISKINSSIFSTGDSILFKRNGTWNEKLIVPTSGIIIGSYGTGNKPVITGLMTITGFTNDGNIWSADVSESVPNLNTVLIGGVMRAKGRYPNTGYLTFTKNKGKGQIIGNLTGTPDYTGAECVVRSSHWVIDVVKILSQSVDTLNFRDSLTYVPLTFGGTGYFIQNTPLVLDTLGEWAYDSVLKKIYVYATSSPTVQISIIDTLVYLHNKDSVTFDGLQFIGGNMANIFLDTARHTTIKNCIVNNSGRIGIQGFRAPYTTIKKDSILNSWNNGIYMREMSGYFAINQTCDTSVIDSNYIKNTGTKAGMGMSGNGRYIGIDIVGHRQTITNNRMDSTGFNGIVWYGQNSVIKYNYVTTSCFVKDDGGGINTGIAPNLPDNYDDGSVVVKNIVLNTIGADAGTNFSQQASGIMLDNYTGKVTVDSNTVINSYIAGILLNDCRNCVFRENTISSANATPFYVGQSGTLQTSTLKHNIFYSSSTTQPILSLVAGFDAGNTDSNYYMRPLAQTTIMQLGGPSGIKTLSQWQNATGVDANSHELPSNITADMPIVYYNPTMQDSVIKIIGLHIDAKGNTYNNSAIIPPFRSLILFKADYEIGTRQFSIGNLKFSTQ